MRREWTWGPAAWVFLSEPAHAPMPAQWGDHYLTLLWQQRRWALEGGLIRAGATSVPRAAAVKIAPLECAALWARSRPIGDVEGFDLSAFNRLWPQRKEGEACPMPLTQLPHAPLGEAVEALRVDIEASTAADEQTVRGGGGHMTYGNAVRGGRAAVYSHITHALNLRIMAEAR